MHPFNARIKAEADKRKAKLKEQFARSGLSRAEFAAKHGFTRQNLDRIIGPAK